MKPNYSFIQPVQELIDSFPRKDLPPFWISRSTPASLIDDDVARINSNYYPHRILSNPRAKLIIDFGARSGLFALYHAAHSQHVTVIAVEENRDLFYGLKQTVSRSPFANIKCFNSRAKAFSYLSTLDEDSLAIGLFKVEYNHFDYVDLENFSQNHKVDFLCGEFKDYGFSAAELYRLSQRIAKRFYWKNILQGESLVGVNNRDKNADAPEVSIVVPAYGVEKYLDQCLSSLMGQTLKHKEIIVVNDGSLDSSGKIADAWAEQYSEVVVIHQKNSGCASARSNGLKAAKGQYVGFVDSDDWVDPEMYEKLFDAAVSHNAEVAQAGYREIYEDDGVVIQARESFLTKDEVRGNHLVTDVPAMMTLKPTIWRRIYRRSFLLDNHIDFPHDIPRFDDLPFQFEVFMNAVRVVAIPDIFYNYRLGRVGQDVGATDERLYVHFDIFDILREKCSDIGDHKLERQLKKVQMNTHMWASERIEKQFKQDYLTKAWRDIFDQKLMVSRFDIITDSLRISPRRTSSMLIAMLKSLLTRQRSKP